MLNSKDLAALMRLARGGDDEAYRRLLGRVAAWLRGVARRGLVRFDGIDITRRPTHEIARMGVAWVP